MDNVTGREIAEISHIWPSPSTLHCYYLPLREGGWVGGKHADIDSNCKWTDIFTRCLLTLKPANNFINVFSTSLLLLILWSSSSSSWREDSWGPLRRLSNLHDDRDPVPSSTPVWYSVVIHCQSAWSKSYEDVQTAPGWYPDLTAITCFRIWCAGMVASNLATRPNSMWRLLIIVSVMFGRPVWTATPEFLTWSFHMIWWYMILHEVQLAASMASYRARWSVVTVKINDLFQWNRFTNGRRWKDCRKIKLRVWSEIVRK